MIVNCGFVWMGGGNSLGLLWGTATESA